MTDTVQTAPTQAGGLRRLADLVEQHPDVFRYVHPAVNVFADTPEAARALRRQLGGGTWRKEHLATWFALNLDLGGGVLLTINIDRAKVCERVKVGTETVQVPDPAAPTVTVEQDVYEWRCGDALAEVAS